MKAERGQGTKRFNRRSFLVGSVGVGLAGFAGCTSEDDSTSASVTTDDSSTVPASTFPNTTTTTTIEATTTTLPPRVFANPEQRTQVEAVEANMKKFFALTADDLARYKETTRFSPDPDGLATSSLDPVTGLSGATGTYVGAVGVNLGTLQVPAGEGLGFLAATGHMSDDGSRFVLLLIVYMSDPILEIVYPGYAQSSTTETVKGAIANGVQTYQVGSGGSEIARSSVGRIARVEELNSSIGRPLSVFYITNPETHSSTTYPVQPNPTMDRIVTRISSTGFGLAKTLGEFSEEALQSVGIYKAMALLSQETLDGYETPADLMHSLLLADAFQLFDGIPAII